MSEVRLYGLRLSPFVEKVARALGTKKVDFELKSAFSPMELRRLNPQTGKMPVIEIGDQRVHDSSFILRRLDRDFPEPPLYASDPKIAAAQHLLEDWSDESLYWYGMAARWAEPNAAATTDQLASMAPAALRWLARLTFPRQITGMTRSQGLGRLPYEVLMTEIGKLLDDLVHTLGDEPFFHGERISGADLAIYGQLNTAKSGPTPDFAELISHRPALVSHARRVEEQSGGPG